MCNHVVEPGWDVAFSWTGSRKGEVNSVKFDRINAENVVLHPERSDRGLSSLVTVPEAEADADDVNDTLNEVD